MSDLVVKVNRIQDIKPHSNADNLEIITIDGWQVVSKKGEHWIGEEVIFIPVDAMIPWELAEKWGIANYLTGYENKTDKYSQGGKVRTVKLRGEFSNGVIIKNEDNFEFGEDVKEFYGIWKYEQPITAGEEDYEPDYVGMPKYTDIQLLNNFLNHMDENERIVATEKIHGTHVRLSIKKSEDNQEEFLISSNNRRLKTGKGLLYEIPFEQYPNIKQMLSDIYHSSENISSVVLYGEIYGSKVQGKQFCYGKNLGEYGFVAFDLRINYQFKNYDDFVSIMDKYGIPRVPLVYQGKFDYDKILELTNGNSLMCSNEQIREGLVIKPIIEKISPVLGRLILKIISNEFNLKRK